MIDEEQRFGVAQKERIRSLVETVDVLTLTATPIPRTLHMSLARRARHVGHETPPRGRLPIHTEILEMSEDVIRDALLREIDRGGQVFFVHNRVETIDRWRTTSTRSCPRCASASRTARCASTQLERVMLEFLERRTTCWSRP